MLNSNSIERNKNTIINIIVIIVAVIVAFQLYRSSNDQVNALIQQQNEALEKNKVTQEIAELEKKAAVYQGVFVRKDLGSVADFVSGVAKESLVKIISVKPYAEEATDNYFSSSFFVNLHSPSYHALGDFIQRLENDKEVYLVSEVNINAAPNPNADPKVATVELDVTLKISTIAYL